MDANIKEYFANGRHKIKEVFPCDDYCLIITFDNDEVKKYDLSNRLFGLFSVLKDKEKFKEVFIDYIGNVAWDIDKKVNSNKAWNNRIDLCPDSLYLNSVPIKNVH